MNNYSFALFLVISMAIGKRRKNLSFFSWPLFCSFWLNIFLSRICCISSDFFQISKRLNEMSSPSTSPDGCLSCHVIGITSSSALGAYMAYRARKATTPSHRFACGLLGLSMTARFTNCFEEIYIDVVDSWFSSQRKWHIVFRRSWENENEDSIFLCF